MAANIIISFDGSENDHDALALGRIIADGDASVSLAYVRHSLESDNDRETAAQRDAEAILARGAQWLGAPEIERHVVVNASTPEGLRQLAEEQDADVVVFGSDWHTTPGHVQPLQSALRMLDGGPVAIAIAAAGLRNRPDGHIEHVAIPGGEVDPAARATAEAFAARAGQPLALPTQENVDLLVVGSRPGASEGRVSLSSAAEYLVETTTASVLVLARGVAYGVATKKSKTVKA
ncbi:MAG: universal stress protein [Solirubrobacteraceae bacterium]|jgi:nucleotide-binding universal stress UspA family protein